MHDPCAIAYLLDPTLFAGGQADVKVVLDGEQRGRTVRHGNAAGKTLVLTKVTALAMEQLVLPYRNRMNNKDTHFQSLLAKCNIVGVISENYSKDCFLARNRNMVQNSSRVIAVYDGRETGGTFFSIRYARVMERDLHIIEL